MMDTQCGDHPWAGMPSVTIITIIEIRNSRLALRMVGRSCAIPS